MASVNKATILGQLQDTATRIKQYILQQISDLSDAVLEAIPETYAGSAEAGGVADKAAAIPYGHVDSTSTATAYTATIDGITELVDGTTVLLKNGVVTSKAGFTININSLGAKPVYNNMAAASAETTIFNVAYTLLLVYDSTRVSGGCWINYRGYYSDSNTVPTGYCTTAAGTAAKAATCNYGYRDDDNYFPCLFRYENTAANATLAISSYATTAAPIYVNGSRTSASNTFGRGVILFLYHDGAYYCYNDGRFPIVVDGAVTSVQEYVAAKYTKPSGGIPKTDLASDVQASLSKADTALQSGDVVEPLSVTYTITSTTVGAVISATCNKTHAQIVSAMNSGIPIMAFISYAGVVNLMANATFSLDPGSGAFSAYIVLSNSVACKLNHKSDDTCTVQMTSFATDTVSAGNDSAISSEGVYNALTGITQSIFDTNDAGKFLAIGPNGELTTSDGGDSLPAVTSADDGKVLMVVNGAWAAGSIPSATGVSF